MKLTTKQKEVLEELKKRKEIDYTEFHIRTLSSLLFKGLISLECGKIRLTEQNESQP